MQITENKKRIARLDRVSFRCITDPVVLILHTTSSVTVNSRNPPDGVRLFVDSWRRTAFVVCSCSSPGVLVIPLPSSRSGFLGFFCRKMLLLHTTVTCQYCHISKGGRAANTPVASRSSRELIRTMMGRCVGGREPGTRR